MYEAALSLQDTRNAKKTIKKELTGIVEIDIVYMQQNGTTFKLSRKKIK